MPITREDLAEELRWYLKDEDGKPATTVAARDEVRWFFDTIAASLAAGEEVSIHGFGSFKLADRAARMGRNPRTGEAVKVPARRVVRFAPSSSLSASLKGSKPKAKAKARR